MPNIKYILIIALLAETLALTVLHEYFNACYLPIFFLISSLTLTLASIKLGIQISNAKIPSITLGVFIIFLSVYVIHRSPLVFDLIPIDYQVADMLPVMKVMAQRCLHGGIIYSVIPEIWGGIQPIYLPGLWLPGILPELLDIDVRWIGVIGLIATMLLVIFINSFSPRIVLLPSIFLCLLIFFIWISRFHLNILSMTNEGLVFFYYALLCFGIVRKKYVLIGIALACCLLSRYYIAPWAVMIMIVYWTTLPRLDFYKILLSSTVTVLLLMTIGQAWNELDTFLGLPGLYLEALTSQPEKYHPLIDQSLSLARHFDFNALPNIHFTVGILMWIVPGLCYVYYRKNKANIDLVLFALASMKLTLIVFFSLMTMPYHYLFFTSFIVSLCLVSYKLRGVNSQKIDL